MTAWSRCTPFAAALAAVAAFAACGGTPGQRSQYVSFAQSWSPDGRWIAFETAPLPLVSVSAIAGACPDTDRSDIYVVAARGGIPRKIAHGTGPMWSSDSSRITFTRRAMPTPTYGNAARHFVVNRDGTGLRRLPLGEGPISADDSSASWCRGDFSASSWSPDGTARAAEVHNNKTGGIWIQIVTRAGKFMASSRPASARATRRHTREWGSSSSQEIEPAWSPDGRELAFARVCCGGPGRGIYVMNRDGTARRRLTKFGTAPRWSPDGTRIAFRAGETSIEAVGIYVVNVDGSGLRRVSATR